MSCFSLLKGRIPSAWHSHFRSYCKLCTVSDLVKQDKGQTRRRRPLTTDRQFASESRIECNKITVELQKTKPAGRSSLVQLESALGICSYPRQDIIDRLTFAVLSSNPDNRTHETVPEN
jgi:hypothetical protein